MAESEAGAAATATTTTNNDSDKTDLTPGHDAGDDLKEKQTSDGAGVEEEQKEPEEALETHEVVEINKFTEKKEWIEEKIKVSLQKLDPGSLGADGMAAP
jgi:hypothetical protein